MDISNDESLGVVRSGPDAGSSGADAPTGAAAQPTDPRLQALIVAARFYGMELDPGEYPRAAGETVPSAASLSAWAQSSGMWARAVRLRWRQLLRFQDTGPVVLLFADGSAGLLTG